MSEPMLKLVACEPNKSAGEGRATARSVCQLQRRVRLDAEGLYFCAYDLSATGMLRQIGIEALAIGSLMHRK